MADQKKIGDVFGVVVIAFLVVTMVIMNNFNNKKFNDEKEYMAGLASLVQLKNNKIILLSKQLAQKQKDYDSLQKTLIDTRNNLEALSKKMPETNLPPASATK